MKKLLPILLLLCLLGGCHSAREGAAAAPETSAPPISAAPTATAAPTPTQAPTQTPRATAPAIPAPTSSPALTPAPTAAPAPVETPFTIVWMADTQNLPRDNPEVFFSMRDWILENREKENIQFVIHSGDVVDGQTTGMKANAEAALVPLFEALPGMIVSGNHDIPRSGSHWYFVQSPYAQLIRKEGQTYGEEDACYVTFRAGGTDFLVFGIGFGISCPGWMRQVIARHPDHVVIAVLHAGLQESGDIQGPMKAILERVAPEAPGLRLMVCGHMRGTATRVDWFDDDNDGEKERSVTSMMFNFQEDRVDGLGFMRLLRFDPATRSIEVETYSPWFDKWGYPHATEEENHFLLENTW